MANTSHEEYRGKSREEKLPVVPFALTDWYRTEQIPLRSGSRKRKQAEWGPVTNHTICFICMVSCQQNKLSLALKIGLSEWLPFNANVDGAPVVIPYFPLIYFVVVIFVVLFSAIIHHISQHSLK